MCFVNLLHFGGKVVVPGLLLFDWLTLGVARRQGFDQGTLGWGDFVGQGKGGLGAVVGRAERIGLGDGIHHPPLEIVVRAAGVGDAPMGHGAAGVVLQGFLETLDRHFVVVGIRPD
jgi:hypothetical protein